MIRRMIMFIDDLLILAGCSAILYGTWLLSPTAAWFVGGAMSIIIGTLIAIGQRSTR